MREIDAYIDAGISFQVQIMSPAAGLLVWVNVGGLCSSQKDADDLATDTLPAATFYRVVRSETLSCNYTPTPKQPRIFPLSVPVI